MGCAAQLNHQPVYVDLTIEQNFSLTKDFPRGFMCADPCFDGAVRLLRAD
jgi:hypothetical protein